MKMKLELVPVPVSDVDRSRQFYAEKLGFIVDVDVRPTAGLRVVQLTPPGSACSIGIGYGASIYDDIAPGTMKNLHLVVEDIKHVRTELAGRGVEVSEIVDVGGGVLYAWVSDPDGNTIAFQEMPWRTGDQF